MSIHPTAHIDPTAQLAPDVQVGAFAVIERDVVIGPGTTIGPHAVILPFTTIGANVEIHGHTVLGDTPQDSAFDAATESFVEIGDACIIREGVTIHRGTKPGTTTRLGNHCFLMANSHLGHNAQVGDHAILANGVLLAGYAEIGERCFLAGNSVVHQFCRVGRLAMISGLGALSVDLPPFCILHHTETNRVSGLNSVGLRRAGIPPEERKQIKGAFRLLYREGLGPRDAVAAIREAFDDGPAIEMADFVAATKRGIGRMAS